MVMLYALYCSTVMLTCDMISRDLSVQETYVDNQACIMAIPLAAETYKPIKGVSIRLTCSDRDIVELMAGLQYGEKLT